jgi:hypothetical protein
MNVRIAADASVTSPRVTPKKACGPSIAVVTFVAIGASPSVRSSPVLLRSAASDHAPDHNRPA